MFKPRPIALVAAGVLLAAVAPARATTYNFTTITPPGTPPGDFAFAVGINDNGQVLVSTTAPSVSFDFTDIDDVYNMHSHAYTAIPAAPGSAPLSTEAFGINNSDEIVGWYHPPGGIWQGFSYAAGSFGSVNAFGSNDTYPIGISNNGKIVGTVGTPVQQGYVYSGGIYTTVDGDPYPANSSNATGINDAGEIVLNSAPAASSVFQCDSFLNVGGVNSAIAMPGEANTCAEGSTTREPLSEAPRTTATRPDRASSTMPVPSLRSMFPVRWIPSCMGSTIWVRYPVIISMRTATLRPS